VSHFAVIFDACVLHPAELRDFLMWLSRTRLFRAKRTATIHDEWIRSVVRRRPDDQQEELRKRLLRTANIMNSAIPDSLVAGYESLITGIQLPDPNDRHVVAAAVFARAEVIVTFNLKDFPTASLQAFNVQAQHPDDFVLSLIDIDGNAVCEAARKQRENLQNPKKSVEQLLDGLENIGISEDRRVPPASARVHLDGQSSITLNGARFGS